jgi:hypothetical protein
VDLTLEEAGADTVAGVAQIHVPLWTEAVADTSPPAAFDRLTGQRLPAITERSAPHRRRTAGFDGREDVVVTHPFASMLAVVRMQLGVGPDDQAVWSGTRTAHAGPDQAGEFSDAPRENLTAHLVDSWSDVRRGSQTALVPGFVGGSG